MRLRVLLLALLFVQTASAGVVSGPPSFVTTTDLRPAVDAQFDPAAAAARDGYHLVWSDFYSYAADLSQTQIFGTTLSRDGAPRAPRRHLLKGIDPAIASDGDRALVAAGRVCDFFGDCPGGIGAAFLGADGVPLRTIELETSIAGNHTDVSVAFNGRAYLVTWVAAADGGTSELYAAVFDRDGAPSLLPRAIASSAADAYATAAREGFAVFVARTDGSLRMMTLSDGGETKEDVPLASNAAGPLVAAFDGIAHAVTWRGDGAQRVAFVASGTTQSSLLAPIAGEPAVVPARDGFLFAWETPAGRIAGRLLGRDGSDVALGEIAALRHPDVAAGPALAGDGRSFVLFWTSGREGAPPFLLDAIDIRSANVSLARWHPQGEAVPALSATREEPLGLACSGGSCLTFWRDERGVQYAPVVPGAHAPVAGTRLPSPPESGPQFLDVAWNGVSFLAVWMETLPGAPRVLAMRIGGDGRALDESPLPLPLPPDDVRAVAAGGRFLVVARDRSWSNALVAVRVGADGSLLDAAPFAPLPGRPAPVRFDIASSGTAIAISWVEPAENGQGIVHAAALDANGRLLAAPSAITPSPQTVIDLGVGSRADGHLLVWSVRENPYSYFTRLHAVRLAPSGQPAAAPFSLTDFSAMVWVPRVMPVESGFAVLWHRLTASGERGARVRIVSAGGSLDDSFAGEPLPSVMHDAAPLAGNRFASLASIFRNDLGFVTRAAVTVHAVGGGARTRPVRR